MHAHQPVVHAFEQRLDERGDARGQSGFDDQALFGALGGFDSLGHPLLRCL